MTLEFGRSAGGADDSKLSVKVRMRYSVVSGRRRSCRWIRRCCAWWGVHLKPEEVNQLRSRR